MKKITLIIALCAITSATFAQDEKLARQPVKGDKAISMNLVGVVGLALNSGVDPFNNAQVLDFRYWMGDHFALRVGLGINTLSTTTTTVNDTTGVFRLTKQKLLTKTQPSLWV